MSAPSEVLAVFVSPRTPSRILAATGVAWLVLLGAWPALAVDTPRLDSPRVMPSNGDTNTQFAFSISYYGPASPVSHDIFLDGTARVMTYTGAGLFGSTLYFYKTKLSAGTHKYRFSFKTGNTVLLKPGPMTTTWYTTANVTQVDSFTISGLIRVGSAGVARVRVQLQKVGSSGTTAGATTGTDGRFTAKGLAPGTWVVTPTMDGCAMTPTYRSVTVPPNTTTCDFTAARVK
jgi:Carboxypeptidase regulatory-like domain